jgi:hypothetical protein
MRSDADESLYDPLTAPDWPVSTPRAHREVYITPVRLLAGMPLHSIVQFEQHGVSAALVTGKSVAEYAQQAKGLPTFSPIEYIAAAVAGERSLAFSRDMREWIARKRARPSWRLGPRAMDMSPEAFAGLWKAPPPVEPPTLLHWEGTPGIAGHWMLHGWSIGRMCEHYGVRIESVSIELESGEIVDPCAPMESAPNGQQMGLEGVA